MKVHQHFLVGFFKECVLAFLDGDLVSCGLSWLFCVVSFCFGYGIGLCWIVFQKWCIALWVQSIIV